VDRDPVALVDDSGFERLEITFEHAPPPPRRSISTSRCDRRRRAAARIATSGGQRPPLRAASAASMRRTRAEVAMFYATEIQALESAVDELGAELRVGAGRGW
jgi:hypothetical protein